MVNKRRANKHVGNKENQIICPEEIFPTEMLDGFPEFQHYEAGPPPYQAGPPPYEAGPPSPPYRAGFPY